MPPARTAQRLGRLMSVVPYVVRNPGSHIDELSDSFDVPRDELTADLTKLHLTGLPPYLPGDLVEVTIEDDRVWISMAEHLERPLRLTRPEALALFLRGTELVGTPGLIAVEPLRSALEKLERGLGRETLGELLAEAGDAAPGGPLDRLRAAVDGRERIEIDHYSAARDEVVTRRVDPEEVFGAIGHWYVVAWDHRSGEERMFRVDRIREVRGTGETFEPRGLAGGERALYTPDGEDIEVRLLLHPTARWVAEYYAVTETREAGDALEVTLPTKDLSWVAKLVMRLSGAVEVAGPDELRDLVQATATETLALYRGVFPGN